MHVSNPTSFFSPSCICKFICNASHIPVQTSRSVCIHRTAQIERWSLRGSNSSGRHTEQSWMFLGITQGWRLCMPWQRPRPSISASITRGLQSSGVSVTSWGTTSTAWTSKSCWSPSEYSISESCQVETLFLTARCPGMWVFSKTSHLNFSQGNASGNSFSERTRAVNYWSTKSSESSAAPRCLSPC